MADARVAALVAELTTPPTLSDSLPSPLTFTQRRRGVSHEGGLASLSCFLAKLRSGRNVTMAVLGGSVSAGSSSRVRPDQGGLYHRKLHRWLQRRWPRSHIRHINAAMPAVPPGYMEQCLDLHVPPDVDLVLLEAAANMCGGGGGESGAGSASPSSSTAPCDAGRESVERMLRQLLRFRPGLPAAILVHAFPFWTMQTPKSWYMRYHAAAAAEHEHERGASRGGKAARKRRGSITTPPRVRLRRTSRSALPSAPLSRVEDLAFGFHTQWGHAANEDLLEALGRYYDLPSVSLRNVVWHAMKANRTFNGLRLHELYYDRIHPSNSGHTILAESLIHLMKRANLVLEISADDSKGGGGGGGGGGREGGQLLGAAGDGVGGKVGRSGADLFHSLERSACAVDGASYRENVYHHPRRPLPVPMLPNVAGAAKRRLQCHDAESLRGLAERGSGRYGGRGDGGGGVATGGGAYAGGEGGAAAAVTTAVTTAVRAGGGCVGWSYTIERSPSGIPKPGWISSSPSSYCTFSYALSNTSAPVHRVGVGFLKSYERMGKVAVTCVHECECAPLIIDAHTRERISPLDLVYFSARIKALVSLRTPQPSFGSHRSASVPSSTTIPPSHASPDAPAHPPRCGIQLTILNESSSGEHKFKLTALFLNQHSDDSYFGRWIFSQAAEARGAVEVAEDAERKSQRRARGAGARGGRMRGRGRLRAVGRAGRRSAES